MDLHQDSQLLFTQTVVDANIAINLDSRDKSLDDEKMLETVSWICAKDPRRLRLSRKEAWHPCVDYAITQHHRRRR